MAVSPEIFLQNLCFTNKPSVLLRSHGTLQGLMEPASASRAGDSWSPRIARECAHRNEQISLPSHCTKCPSQCLSAELKSHFKVCLSPRCYSGITLRGGIIVFAIILKAASLVDATLRAASADCVQWEGTGRDKK